MLAGGLFQQRTVLQQLQWRDEYNTSYGRSDSSNFQAHTWPTSPVHRLGRGTSGLAFFSGPRKVIPTVGPMQA